MPQSAANIDGTRARACDTKMFEQLESEGDFELLSAEGGQDDPRASTNTQQFKTLDNRTRLTSATGSRRTRRKERAETARRGGSQAIHDRRERQDLDFNNKVQLAEQNMQEQKLLLF